MSSRANAGQWMLALVLACGLTGVFFHRLWTGGAIIGGDTYSYFMPQKQLLSEQLHAGHFPRWNNRSGFGYPLVAESQTGLFYPPNLVLYRWFSVDTAYNATQLMHYVACWLGTWLLARRVGCGNWGSLLAAVTFTYGWFPSRLCLEWAIVGGCYLPLTLWAVESCLQTRQHRWLGLLSLLLALQMLAGHFHLAFITQLVLAAYVPIRLWWAREELPESDDQSSRRRQLGRIGIALVLSYGLAAPQLIPTLELKQHSQRQTARSEDFNPAYGAIPPLYVTQVFASWWYWYTPDIDRDSALNQMSLHAATNQVEAHLYFGLLPLGIAGLGFLRRRLNPEAANATEARRYRRLWYGLGAAALVYATGALMPVAEHVPGFNFFRGPGRYGIVTTLAVAILAGREFERWLVASHRRGCIWTACVIGVTVVDLWWVSRLVTYATQLRDRPLELLTQSPIRQRLAETTWPRLYAPGPNLTNLLGTASVPEYLGLGPAEYYDSETKALRLEVMSPEFLDWAESVGITHLLSFEPQSNRFERRLTEVYRGPDPFLNRVWGRAPHEFLFLYRLSRSSGRVLVTTAGSEAEADVTIPASSTASSSDSLSFTVRTNEAVTVVVRDLDYPGWSVTVDGVPVPSQRFAKQFRAVDVPAGEHLIHWSFRPTSVRWGLRISAVSLCLVIAACVWRRRQ